MTYAMDRTGVEIACTGGPNRTLRRASAAVLAVDGIALMAGRFDLEEMVDFRDRLLALR